MTTPVSDNPAVTNPLKALTVAQRNALSAVGFYRLQRRMGNRWMIGTRTFPVTTIATLERLNLVKTGRNGGLDLTVAGTIVRDKLAGK